MFRKIALSGFVATAIATSPIAAPSAKAGDNLDNFLIGVTAIGILGAIVHEKNKRDRRKRVTKTHRPVHETYELPPSERRYLEKRKRKHVKKHRHNHVQHLPNECLRQRWTNHGWVQYYGKRCLRRYGY